MEAIETNVYFGTSDDRMTIPIAFELINRFNGKYAPGEKVILEESGITFNILASLRKILLELPLIPTLDLASHEEVVVMLRLCRKLKITDEFLVEGSFKAWTSDARWIKLRSPQLIYYLHSELEELVDIPKYIRLYHEPFKSQLAMVGCPYYDTGLLLRGVMHFAQLQLETCFDMNNAKVQAVLAKLRLEQAAFVRDPALLVDPHSHFEYFKYTPVGDEVWPCVGIAIGPRPDIGEPTIAPLDLAIERFHGFTCGVFQSNGVPDPTFPWESVMFAGGGATKILVSGYNQKWLRSSDVDLFPIGAKFEDRKAVMERVIAWFAARGIAYFAVRGSVVTVYLKGVQRKFQIVSTNAQSISDVIGRFDTTHIQHAFYCNKFYSTPAAAMSLRDKITRFGNTQNIKPVRLVKALLAGYDIEKSSTICNKIIDITVLLEKDTKQAAADDTNNNNNNPTFTPNPQLRQLIQEINTYYYPMPMPGYDEDEETNYIMAMCCKDSNATMATNDPKVVWENVTVSGDFNNCYESTQFTTFNPAIIQNKGNRRITTAVLKSKHGAIRLTSDFAVVTKVNAGDDGVTAWLKITQEFAEFIKTLEGNIYRMFRQGGVGVKMVSDEGIIAVTIARHTIDAQLAKGQTVIRNQRAVPLDIDEDLNAGDRIQFMFLMEFRTSDDDRRVLLKPLRFIKYVSGNVIEHVEGDEVDVDVDVDVDSKDKTEAEIIEYED
jgi:hypothetical protein